MADAGENTELSQARAADVGIGGDVLVDDTEAGAATEHGTCSNGMPLQREPMEDATVRVTYIDYLKSPVIELLVGQGEKQALLTAHQALLVRSPWFVEACANFSDNDSVSIPPFLS